MPFKSQILTRMYTYRNGNTEFRIVRRARRWYIEGRGETMGHFASAAEAARALAECELIWPDAGPFPVDLQDWTRGGPDALDGEASPGS